MEKPDYYVCNGEKCEDCSNGTLARCGDCSYCIDKLMPDLVFPFDNPNVIDEEAVHLILRENFYQPPPRQ